MDHLLLRIGRRSAFSFSFLQHSPYAIVKKKEKSPISSWPSSPLLYVLSFPILWKPLVLEGEIDEEHCPGADLNDGKAILSYLVENTNREENSARSWEEAELTDAFFNREDSYIFFDGRWMRRSDAPWRRDRAN